MKTKTILIFVWVLALTLANSRADPNVSVINPANRPVPVTQQLKSGATAFGEQYSASHITTNTTVTPTSATCYVSSVVISCSNAGTTWTLLIRNKEGTPKILVPSFTLTVPTTGLPIVIALDEPILMTSGIDIVTAAGTPGVVDVWITYWQ